MNGSDAFPCDPMLEMFLFEAVQLIEQLEERLLDIERNGSLTPESVNEIFRIMHTIKGSSAMMAYDEISRLAHALEDLFDSIRAGRKAPVDCARLNDHVLKGIDFIKAELAKIESGREGDGRADDLISDIGQFRETFMGQAETFLSQTETFLSQSETFLSQSEMSIGQAETAGGPPPLTVRQRASAVMDPGQAPAGRYAARIFFEAGCQMENLRAFAAIRSLEPQTVALAFQPADVAENEKSSDIIRENGFQIYMVSHAGKDVLTACLEETMFLERLEFEPVSRFPAGILEDEADAAAEEGHLAPGGTSPLMAAEAGEPFPEQALRQIQNRQQSLISVSIHKLDQLVDLVGELVISEAMVTRNPDLAGLQLPGFEKAARQLRKLTNELQDIVMSIRMVPIAATFHKMQRLVRDMARKLGKEVALVLQGEETEVDKRVIDSLADPLMHLIRNSLDHGLECPAERLAAGKPVQGTLSLEARAAGGDVWITVRDDGRGLDRERILQKARERHLLARPEAEFSEKEIFSLIMLPGFSTRDAVSEFSGRGVGMDAVRENIARIGGSISLESTAGAGTAISIRIPMTLAIINGMQIAVGDASYIIPITAIRESFRIDGQQMVVDMDGNEMLMIRGACCNVIRLHRRFSVANGVAEPESGIMVVVEDEGHACCILADRLVGEQQVVVKPLPAYIRKTPGLAGCTILGDGSISLILDIRTLMRG